MGSVRGTERLGSVLGAQRGCGLCVRGTERLSVLGAQRGVGAVLGAQRSCGLCVRGTERLRSVLGVQRDCGLCVRGTEKSGLWEDWSWSTKLCISRHTCNT